MSTILNAVGVRFLALVTNAGVFSELLGVVTLIALLFAHVRRPVAAVITSGAFHGPAAHWGGALLASAALTASYVMYGFDTAGSLAEETSNPRRTAPRAILQALGAAGVLGFVLLVAALMAAGALDAPELGRIDGGLPSIVTGALGLTFGRVLLCDVLFAIFVCALAVHAGAVRLVFAMARDGRLPYAAALSHVSPRFRTPVLPAVIVGAAAIGVLVVNVNLPRIVELVTMVAVLWANLAYLLVNASLLRPAAPGVAASRQPGWCVRAGRSRNADQRRCRAVEHVHGRQRGMAARVHLRPVVAAAIRASPADSRLAGRERRRQPGPAPGATGLTPSRCCRLDGVSLFCYFCLVQK